MRACPKASKFAAYVILQVVNQFWMQAGVQCDSEQTCPGIWRSLNCIVNIRR